MHQLPFRAVGIALLLALLPAPGFAATFDVDNTLDAGAGSLRQAVLDANAASGADIIDATGVTGTIVLSSGEIVVSDAVTVQGPGDATLSIDAQQQSRIFNASAPLEISGLALRNGALGLFCDGATSVGGAGIFAGAGLVLTDVTLEDNASLDVDGGGAYVIGDVTLTRVHLFSNDSIPCATSNGGHGGGIYATGNVSMVQSLLETNFADIAGSAVYAEGDISLTDSLAKTNSGGAGTALFGRGDITVVNSTLFQNAAISDIDTRSVVESSGDAATIGLYHATFSDNRTALRITGSASTLRTRNTILWDDAVEADAVAGTAFDIQYSLLTNASGTGIVDGVDGNVVGHDPLFVLGAPADYGGRSQVMAITPNSPAFNSGGPSPLTPPPAYDQRGPGFPRIVGAATDMGAFEMLASTSFEVNSLADPGDGVCDVAECTLREAIEAADLTIADDTINFQPGLSGTITLTAGTLDDLYGITINGPGASLLTIDAQQDSPVMWIGAFSSYAAYTATLHGLTLTGGSSTSTGAGIKSGAQSLILDAVTITGNQTSNEGGGVFSRGNTITLQNGTLISNNQAGLNGGGISAFNSTSLQCVNSSVIGNVAEMSGGGAMVGSANLDNCTFSDNQANGAEADGYGGGLHAMQTATIANSTFTDNHSDLGYGGGVTAHNVIVSGSEFANSNSGFDAGAVYVIDDPNSAGSLSISDSSFDGNQSGIGGAIFVGYDVGGIIQRCIFSNNIAIWGGAISRVDGSLLMIEDSLFSANQATSSNTDRGGGALFLFSGGSTNIVRNSTFSANTSAGAGGAISARDAGTVLALENSTITGNTAAGNGGGISGIYNAGITISNSIVAGNSATTPGDLYSVAAAIWNVDYSLIGDTGNSGIVDGVSGNIVGVAPGLEPLADNGGPTRTHALQSASPALNAGDPAFVPPPDFDQRGAPFARVQMGRIDMGAFELLPIPVSLTLDPASAQLAEAGGSATLAACLPTGVTAAESVSVTLGLSGTATPGVDHNLADGTVMIIAVGANCATTALSAVDDALDEDDETVIVDIASVSANSGAYVEADPAQEVTATIVDDDTAGISVAPVSGLITTETGGTATFNVLLNSQPSDDVTIALSSTDLSEGTLSASSITFTPGTWNIGQEITVSGVDDNIDDGDISYSIITAPAVSADPDYSGLDAIDVSATNLDNENPNLGVGIDDGDDDASYGEVLIYSIQLNNIGLGNATGVHVQSLFSPGLDDALAHWECFGAGGANSCTAQGDGPLDDTVSVGAGASLGWILTVPVIDSTPENSVTTTMDIDDADSGIHIQASDTDTVVLFRDGFDGT